MKEFFGSDGPFLDFIRRIGLLIFASLLWLLGSLPVLTIGSSSAALYYAVVKCIIHDRSHVGKEFFRAYKRNFWKGLLITIGTVFLAFMIYLNREVILAASEGNEAVLASYFLGSVGGSSVTVFVVLNGLAIFLFAVILYLLPVMTRFEMKLGALIKFSVFLAIRYFYFTIVLMLAAVFIVALMIKVLPIPCVLIMPGAWTIILSFFVEKAMRPYMGEAKEGEDAWWLE